MKEDGVERWTGLVFMADGVAGLVWPREYLRKLKIGPQLMNDLLEHCAERPTLTRFLCVAEIVFGASVFFRRR